MAKFCTNCGKKLKEGEVCDCKKQSQTSSSSIVSTFVDLVKGMFVNPVDTMSSFIEEANFNTALISLGVNAVAISIFIAILCKELMETVLGLMGFSSSLYGGLGLTNQIDIPYVKIILISILTVMIVYAMIAFIAYLISEKVFKSETSYKKMITWLGVTSTLLTAVVLVAAIFSLMSVKVGLVIYAAGAMLNTYYMYKGLSFACNTDENKLGYILMPAILVTAFVVGYILPKILF
jgi:hypothetical protein